MSDVVLIKATAQKLVELLQTELGKMSGLPACTVTTDSPAALLGRTTTTGNTLSVFVYRVEVDTSSRQAVVPSERQRNVPPLLLNVYVLLTPISEKADDASLLLDAAMEVLHSTPVILTDAAQGAKLTLEVSPQPLSLRDMTQLWLALATPYHLSVGYEVRVRFK